MCRTAVRTEVLLEDGRGKLQRLSSELENQRRNETRRDEARLAEICVLFVLVFVWWCLLFVIGNSPSQGAAAITPSPWLLALDSLTQ